MHWLKLPTILILLLNKLFKSMTYQNLLKDYLSIEHRIQLYKTIWGGTYLYDLNRIFSKIFVNYQYDNTANSMGEHKMFNILTHFHICYMKGQICYMNVPIYYMKGQIYDIY